MQLNDLLKKHGVDITTTATATTRSKLLHQVNRMLDEIGKYKTEDELNGKSLKYWWSNKSNNGRRQVAMRYDNKVVQGTSTYVDNTLESVTQILQAFKNVIEESDDTTWEEEEERRKK